MNDRQLSDSGEVDALIETICRKLKANREILMRSLSYGRLVWRSKRNGEVDIDLELKL